MIRPGARFHIPYSAKVDEIMERSLAKAEADIQNSIMKRFRLNGEEFYPIIQILID